MMRAIAVEDFNNSSTSSNMHIVVAHYEASLQKCTWVISPASHYAKPCGKGKGKGLGLHLTMIYK